MIRSDMSKLFLVSGLSLIFCVITGKVAQAQSLLSPPYGQEWTETPTRFLGWAEAQELDITITLPADSPSKRYIKAYSGESGAEKIGIYSIEARYHQSQLYEVTVDYYDPVLKTPAAKTKYLDAKKAIVNKYGPMKPGEKSKSEKDSYVTEVVSYHIEPVGGLMLVLLSTEVTDVIRKKSLFRFSLIYRNENVIVNSRRR